MTTNDRLQKALEQQKDSSEPAHKPIAGILGIPLNGKKQVEVQGRNGFLYVRLRNNQSEVIQAFNNQVSPAYNLPVLVERQGNRYVVTSVDTQRYGDNWTSFSSYLPRHGNTHSFDLESGGGGDIVWVQSRQITPLLAMPSGSDGGPNVIINPYTLKNDNGSWKYIGNTGTQNLTTYNPSSPTGAVMVLVYADSVSGNPYILVGSGTVFSNSITGTSQIPPYVPSVSNPAHIPLAAVRLITGTSSISWNNIYDVRQWLHTTPTGTGGGAVGPVGPAGSAGVMAWDEGVPLGTGTVFNFVGSNVHASISGSVVRVFVTGSSGGTALTVDDAQGISVANVNRITFTGTAIPEVVDEGGGHALVYVQNRGVEVLDVGGTLGTGITRLEFDESDVTFSGTVARTIAAVEDGPQGFGYNYVIDADASVSGSLTVALKTLAGTNPSPTDKLIFRVGDSRREITSAMSATIPSGTNWCNAAGAELVGKDIDFFVYLIWQTAGGGSAKIGISRIPYAKTMGEFVNTSNSEKYIAGNWTIFDSIYRVENIGRIRKLLSSTMVWSDINPVTISHPIYWTEWSEWTPEVVGFNPDPTFVTRYKLIDNLLHLGYAQSAAAASDSTSFTVTMPFKAKNIANYFQYSPLPFVLNNSAQDAAGFAFTTPDSNLLTLKRTLNQTWTASNNKNTAFNIAIEIE